MNRKSNFELNLGPLESYGEGEPVIKIYGQITISVIYRPHMDIFGDLSPPRHAGEKGSTPAERVHFPAERAFQNPLEIPVRRRAGAERRIEILTEAASRGMERCGVADDVQDAPVQQTVPSTDI